MGLCWIFDFGAPCSHLTPAYALVCWVTIHVSFVYIQKGIQIQKIIPYFVIHLWIWHKKGATDRIWFWYLMFPICVTRKLQTSSCCTLDKLAANSWFYVVSMSFNINISYVTDCTRALDVNQNASQLAWESNSVIVVSTSNGTQHKK